MARKAATRKVEKDPIVRQGDSYREFRVQFWEYFSTSLLKAFAKIAQSGDFGRITSFKGVGRTRDGREYAFRWRRGGPLAIGPGSSGGQPGCILLRGRLDFETVNRIRNFPIFHLRAGLGYVG